ncbi:MAG: YcaO-like family protein [Patescibacteria group bacterium]
MKISLRHNLNSLYELLIKRKILKSVIKVENIYYDELKFYFYKGIFNHSNKMSKYNKSQYNSDSDNVASGISVKSKSTALLKCLVESLERYSLCTYSKESIIQATFNRLSDKALNPGLYKHDRRLSQINMGWIKGYDLINNRGCFIPAQLVYLTYPADKEILLTTQISTGAAGGIDFETTVLRGIYEVIERDAFMTMYLNKIKASRINLNSLNSDAISFLVKQLQRYNLELFLFNITNDMQIPSFFTLLLDRTGLGPVITVGAKSGFTVEKAIVGAIEESLMPRQWLRYEIQKRSFRIPKVDHHRINNITDRALYWSQSSNIKHFDFLIHQKPEKYKIIPITYDTKTELKRVIQIIKNNNYKIYYANITPKFVKNNSYYVYKIIIPGLQALYLDEAKREINSNRLIKTAHFFGKKNTTINNIPHPFL